MKVELCECDKVILQIPDNVWPAPCIQWQVLKNKKCEWEDLRGETKLCLIFRAQLRDHQNKYRAIVKSECECYVTNESKLIVNFIQIIKNPVSIEFSLGETAMFMAEAEGRPEPSIQWQVSTNGGQNWLNLEDEILNTLEFVMELDQCGNLYRAVFQNKCGRLISKSAQLLPNVQLILDDGKIDRTIGAIATRQFLWLNRFTPQGYPFILEEIQVYFSGVNSNVLVGDPIDLYVWENTSGNSNPAIGDNFRGSLIGQQVQVLNDFNSYPLTNSITFNGPGDVLIGVVDRLPLDDPRYPNYSPAAIDTTVSQMRSWFGVDYTGNIVPNPPTLPAPVWNMLDNIGIQGNWMIRGFGCGPVPGVQVQLLPEPLPQIQVQNLAGPQLMSAQPINP